MKWSASVLLLLVLGCKKPGSGEVERAPVTPGGALVYEVTESSFNGPVVHQITLGFKARGDGWRVEFAATPPGESAAPIEVDGGLIPQDNVISAYSIGRLYLPTPGRADGKRTPCGAVGPVRKYQQWDVFPVDGLCGTKAGTRFYEANTGMLVGWIYAGASDESAVLKESR